MKNSDGENQIKVELYLDGMEFTHPAILKNFYKPVRVYGKGGSYVMDVPMFSALTREESQAFIQLITKANEMLQMLNDAL